MLPFFLRSSFLACRFVPLLSYSLVVGLPEIVVGVFGRLYRVVVGSVAIPVDNVLCSCRSVLVSDVFCMRVGALHLCG